MEIHKLLTLSTVHLPEEYASEQNWFQRARSADGVGCILVFVSNDPEDTPMDYLLPIFEFARKHDVAYIWFDPDGPIETGLPQFDWE